MKKLWVLPIAFVLFSCGGGGGETAGSGGSIGGFYSLSLNLDQRDIVSPSVSGLPSDFSIPTDTISGTVSLSYSGNLSNPLRGVIQRAQLCIDGLSCYLLPINGVLTPNATPLSFNLSVNSHKFGLPWIAINPYEDKILNTTTQAVPLTTAGTSRTQTDNYFNTTRSINLSYIPVAKNSLVLVGNGDFNKQTAYGGYTSAMGTVSVVLSRGTVSTNQVKPNSVQLIAGSLRCKDDGSGDIVEDVGTPPGACSGSINYTTGNLSFQINGISSATDVQINYTVLGSQLCLDNGSGALTGDCSGSIDYTSGALSYTFNGNFVNTPTTVNISWVQSSAAGTTITYTLPPPQVVGPYIYQVAGRLVEVYQDSTLLCNNQGVSGVCEVSVNNYVVSVDFPGGVLPGLTLRYSQDTKIDINPSIDASVYGGQYGGSPNPTVSGYVEVEVKLESGEVLKARSNINFRVVPQ